MSHAVSNGQMWLIPLVCSLAACGTLVSAWPDVIEPLRWDFRREHVALWVTQRGRGMMDLLNRARVWSGVGMQCMLPRHTTVAWVRDRQSHCHNDSTVGNSRPHGGVGQSTLSSMRMRGEQQGGLKWPLRLRRRHILGASVGGREQRRMNQRCRRHLYFEDGNRFGWGQRHTWGKARGTGIVLDMACDGDDVKLPEQ